MTFRAWTLRLLASVTRRRADDDLEQELRAHLELAAEGRSPAIGPFESGPRRSMRTCCARSA
jgi:hypothetical protein